MAFKLSDAVPNTLGRIKDSKDCHSFRDRYTNRKDLQSIR